MRRQRVSSRPPVEGIPLIHCLPAPHQQLNLNMPQLTAMFKVSRVKWSCATVCMDLFVAEHPPSGGPPPPPGPPISQMAPMAPPPPPPPVGGMGAPPPPPPPPESGGPHMMAPPPPPPPPQPFPQVQVYSLLSSLILFLYR